MNSATHRLAERRTADPAKTARIFARRTLILSLVLAAANVCAAPNKAAAAPQTHEPALRDRSLSSEQLVRKYSLLAGSEANARALVEGLRRGSTIRLSVGRNRFSDIKPSSTPLSYQTVDAVLAYARQSLEREHATWPATPDQIDAAVRRALAKARRKKQGPEAAEAAHRHPERQRDSGPDAQMGAPNPNDPEVPSPDPGKFPWSPQSPVATCMTPACEGRMVDVGPNNPIVPIELPGSKLHPYTGIPAITDTKLTNDLSSARTGRDVTGAIRSGKEALDAVRASGDATKTARAARDAIDAAHAGRTATTAARSAKEAAEVARVAREVLAAALTAKQAAETARAAREATDAARTARDAQSTRIEIQNRALGR